MTRRGRFGRVGRGIRRVRLGFSRTLLRLRLAYARSELGRAGFGARQFKFVPPFLDAADPTVAADIAAGQVVLAGRMLLTGKRTPFDFPPPSPAFARALESFEWLAHFDANDRQSLRDHARRMVWEWLARRESASGGGLEPPEVVARRVISWLAHSGLIVEGADHAAYQALIGRLARDAAVLRRFVARRDVGIAALTSAIALHYHALCLDLSPRAIGRAEQGHAQALARHVLEDGGTSDRNPASAVRVAADLIPLVALYRARQRPAPEFLTQALQRLVGFVRMMQHHDGGLAHFEGAGLAGRDLAAEVAQFGAGRVARRRSARQSGFERLESASSVLIADTGRVNGASAGALSFEFAMRGQRIVVNCGQPPHLAPESQANHILHSAAAHSGLMVDDHPLQHIDLIETLTGERRPAAFSNGLGAEPVRQSEAHGETLVLVHAGLKARTGFVVQRELTMLPEGGGLAGIDRFIAAEPMSGPHRASLFFHIHPLLTVERTARQDTVLIRAGNGGAAADAWIFEAVGHAAMIEESRCYERDLPNPAGRQIVLDVPLSGNLDVLWRLVPFHGTPDMF